MENQALLDHHQMEEDEFPNEFQCCVCLDIIYKPVVLACGHISCFWCVFKVMDTTQESHCPLCRQSYNHFPRICELMHFLLLMLYPSAYKRREKQVAEEEKGYGHTSPQFDDKLIDSEFCEVPNTQCSSSPLLESVLNKPNATCGGDNSFVRDLFKIKSHNKDNTTNNPTTSTSQEATCVVERRKQDLLTHLQCGVCKQLLCRPAVLNCGHVYCEACISPQDNACKCPKCQSLHPNGFPNVCLILEHFMEEHFPDEYLARKESLSNSQNTTNPSKGSKGKQEQAAQCSTVPKYMRSSLLPGCGLKFHSGVGCDYCGMWPIVGERYKCKDCVESIGFDLCENCYNSPSKLPGRFNQQHTQDHQFEIVQPQPYRDIILSLGAGHFVDVDEVVGIVNSNNGFILTGAYFSNDSLEDELETTSSVNAQDNDSRGDFDDAVASPNSNHNGSQDERGNSAA